MALVHHEYCMHSMFKAHTVYRGSQPTHASCWQCFGELYWHDLYNLHFIKHLPGNIWVSCIFTESNNWQTGRRVRGWWRSKRANHPSSASAYKQFMCVIHTVYILWSTGCLCLCVMCVCVCIFWSRSLEAACCALICAFTVCEHSMTSISTLCGISHRPHLSTFISYCHWINWIRSTIYGVCTPACGCMCGWSGGEVGRGAKREKDSKPVTFPVLEWC